MFWLRNKKTNLNVFISRDLMVVIISCFLSVFKVEKRRRDVNVTVHYVVMCMHYSEMIQKINGSLRRKLGIYQNNLSSIFGLMC